MTLAFTKIILYNDSVSDMLYNHSVSDMLHLTLSCQLPQLTHYFQKFHPIFATDPIGLSDIASREYVVHRTCFQNLLQKLQTIPSRYVSQTKSYTKCVASFLCIIIKLSGTQFT